MCSVYVLYSDVFDRFYVGVSRDPLRRLREHNAGYTKSTKPFIPWRLVHQELFDSMQEARNKEKYLKSAAGRRWRKNNLTPNMGD